MTRKQVESNIEEDVDPIRLQGLMKKRKETLEEWLEKFFTKWNEEKDTIYYKGKKESESDHEVQTEAGKRRSIGDVYMLAKYYYPDCTLAEIKKILLQILPEKVKGFRSSICHKINKRVYYYDSENKSGILNKDDKDEFGMTVDQWQKMR